MDERTNGPRRRPANGVQRLLLVLALLAAGLLLILPLTMIFAQVAAGGWALLIENLSADYLHHAFGLTLLATLVTIPVNLAFGLAFAWCVTHYRFRGRRLMLALIDIPYATSPVVAGLCYLLLYGAESVVGQWFSDHDIQLMFAWPGIIMVTIFVTSPYVARLLIPLMQTQGNEEEQAALLLGASGWQIFRKVSLPRIRWALLYGVMITNARAVCGVGGLGGDPEPDDDAAAAGGTAQQRLQDSRGLHGLRHPGADGRSHADPQELAGTPGTGPPGRPTGVTIPHRRPQILRQAGGTSVKLSVPETWTPPSSELLLHGTGFHLSRVLAGCWPDRAHRHPAGR